ncbi:ABC transporter permease [Pseudomethylobacillus aquaticus]|nr:FtsX-like permease family protein [Pseudomethylobacillus aquaticus]
MLALNLAWRQLRSLWASGEVRVLFLALVLAVAATTTVGLFTDRVASALVREGGLLLGGDMVVQADHPLPAQFVEAAEQQRLHTAQTMEFPSMVSDGEQSQLAEIKAVSDSFPLRGELTIAAAPATSGIAARSVPQPGSVWLEPRLAGLLALAVGDHVQLGESKLRVAALLQQEPSRGGDMFSYAPRLMMNLADVEATGLVQYGSRVRYQLLLAAGSGPLADYKAWAEARLGDGEKLMDVSTARPEMRSALDKSSQFLGLAAMVAVLLAMVAMYLASLPYVQNSFDSYAMMRCLGASRALMLKVLLYQALLLAALGALLGAAIGYVAQSGLSMLAGRLFAEALPAAAWTPLLLGCLAGLLILLAVLWPQLLRLAQVPALRILRRDLEHSPSEGKRWLQRLSLLPALLVMALLLLWQSGDWKLGGAMLVALCGLLAVTTGLARLGSSMLQRLPGSHSGWRLGLAGLRRRPWLAAAQVSALSLGLMALLLLALIRSDLLNNWQQSLPADAPNRFMINIQPDQLDAIQQRLHQAGLQDTQLFPMVRGRLTAVNGEPVLVDNYTDDRARRLAEREFNLSWAADMQADNQLLQGRWWTASQHGQPLVSLEQDLATALGLKVGDRLRYDIAGSPLELTVSSIRKVEWDSMRANFFAVTPPGVLDGFDASYISSFHLPIGNDTLINSLVKAMPNLTVLDIAAIMQQVRGVMARMTHAVEYVFAFSLLAGIAVLYAALAATRAERTREMTLLRVLGARSRQLYQAVFTEFAVIGLLAALVAVLVANLLAYYVSVQVLGIVYAFNLRFSLLLLMLAALLVPTAAWFGVRSDLQQPPRHLLQSV